MRSWMKLIVPALVTLGCSFAYAEGPGHDYPPFVTIEGYERSDFIEHRFDKAVFVSDDQGTKATVAGHYLRMEYRLKDPIDAGDAYLLSSLQEGVKEIEGAQILNQTDKCRGSSGGSPLLTVRFKKDNTPVWVAVSCYAGSTNGDYNVTVVEEQAFHH